MGCLSPKGQPPIGRAVEGAAGGLDDHLADQPGPFLGQDPGGGRQAEAGSGGQDVFDDQVGAILLAHRDDASLGVAGVALLHVCRAGDERDLPLAVLRQPECGRRAGDAAANDQDVRLYWAHALTPSIRSSAARAERATSGGTVTGLMALPLASPSTTWASFSSVMRFIVSQ